MIGHLRLVGGRPMPIFTRRMLQYERVDADCTPLWPPALLACACDLASAMSMSS